MRLLTGLRDLHRHLHVSAGHAIANHDRMLRADRPGRRQLNISGKFAGRRYFGNAPRSLITLNRRGNPSGKGDTIGSDFLPIIERDDNKTARHLRAGTPASPLHMERSPGRDDRRHNDGRTLISSGDALPGRADDFVGTVCRLGSDKHPTDDGSRRGQSQQRHAQSPAVRSHPCRHLHPFLCRRNLVS